MIEVVVATDDDISAQHSASPFWHEIDFARVQTRFGMPAGQTISDLYDRVAEELGGDVDNRRLYDFAPFRTLANRPAVIMRSQETIGDFAGYLRQLCVYLKRNCINLVFDFEDGGLSPILLFLKRYDPAARCLHYVGSIEADPKTPVKVFLKAICTACPILAGRRLQIWCEKAFRLTLLLPGPFSSPNATLESCRGLQTQGILVVQPELTKGEAQRIPAEYGNAPSFFRLAHEGPRPLFLFGPQQGSSNPAPAVGDLNDRLGAVRLNGRSHEDASTDTAPLLPASVAGLFSQLKQAMNQALHDAGQVDEDRVEILSSLLEERDAEEQRLKEELSQKGGDVQRLREQLRESREAARRLRSELTETIQRLDAEAAELRHKLAMMRGDAEACRGMSADELQVAVAEMEAAEAVLRQLAVDQRIVEAQQEAAACPICLEQAKDTRIDCGHLLCSTCSLRVYLCPVCRAHITTRLRAFV